MENIADAITAFLQRNNNPLGLLLLAASALIEYVFPPFPGDTVTLFGAVLVVRHDWSLPLVFTAVMLGSAAGAAIDFYLGVRLARSHEDGKLFQGERIKATVERVIAAFRRHGPAYVAINRFLPGVRAVIFVAAGMARLSSFWVLFYALLSAALWNALIIAAGYTLGANWGRIKELSRSYSLVLWGLISTVAIFFLARWLLRRRRAAKADTEKGGEGGQRER